MFFKFLYSLSEEISGFNVFRYITFRTFLSFITSFIVCYIGYPYFIDHLVSKNASQPIRDDGPKTHFKKKGTPTMGGVLVLVSLLVTSILWADLQNPLVISLLTITFGFGVIGCIDDYSKISNNSSKGISGKLRLILEFSLSIVVVFLLVQSENLSTTVSIPFLKNVELQLGWFYLVFASFVIVGCANAVNLTDGLDGLATLPLIIAIGTYAILTYIAGHFEISTYLQIPFINGASELSVIASMTMAAGLGFLWYNTYPAQITMGDIGSLSMGGLLGMMAILTKNELLLILIGGIFVIEALSVITQVVSFKLTGKRIFKMAPIHHHYELKGMDESKIIVRFWIVSILLAVLSLSTLKMR